MSNFKKFILAILSFCVLISYLAINTKSLAFEPAVKEDTFFSALRAGSPTDVSFQYKNTFDKSSKVCIKFLSKEYPIGEENKWFAKCCMSYMCFFEEGESSKEIKPGESMSLSLGIYPTQDVKLNNQTKIVMEVYLKKEPTQKTVITSYSTCVSPKEMKLTIGQGGVTIKDGRTMVPFRFIGENFGAVVEWDSRTQQISFNLSVMKLMFQIGKKEMQTKIGPGYSKTLLIDVAPILLSGRTYVPLRVIAENLGATVLYDSATRQITIHFPPLPKNGN